MQKQRRTIQWIVEAVKSGRINPLWPDMSTFPDDILEEITWEETPEGEPVPKQAAVDIGVFLVLHAKMAEIVRRDRQIPSQVSVDPHEVVAGLEYLTVLATLEKLKRAGFLEYCPSSAEGCVYASEKIKISKLNKAPYREQDPQIFEQIWKLKNIPNN